MSRRLVLVLAALALAGCTSTVDAGFTVGQGGIAHLSWPAAWETAVCSALGETERAAQAVSKASYEIAAGDLAASRKTMASVDTALASAAATLDAAPAWRDGEPVVAGLTLGGQRVGESLALLRRQAANPKGKLMPAAQEKLTAAGESIQQAMQAGVAVHFGCPAQPVS